MKPVPWLGWRLALGTALIDALKEGLKQVEAAHNPLPVILIVSDGGENASGTSLGNLVASRRQSETLIYAIQLDLAPSRYAPPVNRAFSNFLPQVVGDSGGTILRARTPDEGETAALTLLEELRSQYARVQLEARARRKVRTLKVEPLDQESHGAASCGLSCGAAPERTMKIALIQQRRRAQTSEHRAGSCQS